MRGGSVVVGDFLSDFRLCLTSDVLYLSMGRLAGFASPCVRIQYDSQLSLFATPGRRRAVPSLSSSQLHHQHFRNALFRSDPYAMCSTWRKWEPNLCYDT